MSLECDYFVIGGGAMGMAFTDTLINETQECTVIIVDKHSQPGGHWNDAYPFVRLHQPSAYYGVNSRRLESKPPPSDWKELAELASGPEVVTYFRRVLDSLESTGRVRFMPMCKVEESPRLRVVSLLDAEHSWDVTVRKKVVDATYMHVEVPSTRPPPFPVASGALVVPPNSLPSISTSHPKYVVIGSGKTGMDAMLWLMRHNVPLERLFWVMPRDAWLINRAVLQPGRTLRHFLAGALADLPKLEALVRDDDAMNLAMERWGMFHRIDEQRQPTAARCATVSSEELVELRRVTQVLRSGHVLEVGLERLLLEHGELATGPGTLHVDCTACALARRPSVPVFSESRITLQSVVNCQQVFSAAVLGHMEAKWPGDLAKQNSLSTPVPHPETPNQVLENGRIAQSNLEAWLRNGLFWWLARSRLWSWSHELTASNAWALLPVAARMAWRRKQRPAAPASKL